MVEDLVLEEGAPIAVEEAEVAIGQVDRVECLGEVVTLRPEEVVVVVVMVEEEDSNIRPLVTIHGPNIILVSL